MSQLSCWKKLSLLAALVVTAMLFPVGEARAQTTGTFTKSLSPLFCQPMSPTDVATRKTCGFGGVYRTDGDVNAPCELGSRPQRDTYVCELDLPVGAVIQEITLHGYDNNPTGYFEGFVYRMKSRPFGYEFVSGYAGVWQSSGVAYSGGAAHVSLFSTTHAPHTVASGWRYLIGLATKMGTDWHSVTVEGISVVYSL